MHTHRFAWMWPLIAGLAGWSNLVFAASPLDVLFPFKRIEADESRSYALTEQQGPWMVLATTFAGEGAREDAHELVIELRKRYKLVAFTYEKTYDYSKTEIGLGVNRYGGPKRMRHQNARKFDEVAVLVGNYKSIEDPAVKKTLAKLKTARPECLAINRNKPSTQRFAGLRELQRRISGDPNKKAKGPMGHAFVTRNPLLPQEFFVPKGVDKFVVDMNKGVKYSLLDCTGKYTVRVATFGGHVIQDQRKIAEIQRTGKMKSQLAEAAEKAHRLTTALRKKGVEAYEFHDRAESIVTIGSFATVGTPRADGRIEINPAVHSILQTYGAMSAATVGSQRSMGYRPKSLDGIPFDVQPTPVIVPRKSIASDYAPTGWSFR